MYINYIQILNLFFHNKYFQKTNWVLQNFLTMECYRKLCNKCYWKKAKPHTSSYTRRTFLIFFSILFTMCLSFFYSPNDPANSKSSAYFIRLMKFISTLKVHIINFIRSFINWINFYLAYLERLYSSHIFRSNNYNLALKSSWLI
jgi:hypothetical protein